MTLTAESHSRCSKNNKQTDLSKRRRVNHILWWSSSPPFPLVPVFLCSLSVSLPLFPLVLPGHLRTGRSGRRGYGREAWPKIGRDYNLSLSLSLSFTVSLLLSLSRSLSPSLTSWLSCASEIPELVNGPLFTSLRRHWVSPMERGGAMLLRDRVHWTCLLSVHFDSEGTAWWFRVAWWSANYTSQLSYAYNVSQVHNSN